MSFSNDMFVFQNEDELQIIVSTIECKKAFYKISCTSSQDAHTVRGDEKISIVKQKRKKMSPRVLHNQTLYMKKISFGLFRIISDEI